MPATDKQKHEQMAAAVAGKFNHVEFVVLRLATGVVRVRLNCFISCRRLEKQSDKFKPMQIPEKMNINDRHRELMKNPNNKGFDG
jgi:hypothetical protein